VQKLRHANRNLSNWQINRNKRGKSLPTHSSHVSPTKLRL